MKKLLLLVLLFSAPAFGACTVAGSTYTAASDSASDVQACATLIGSLSSGSQATFVWPSGTATWSSQVTLSIPAGVSVTTEGQSIVTGTGDPYVCTAHTGCMSSADNTSITATLDQNLNITIGSGGFLRITGITWSNNNASASHGTISIAGSVYGQTSFRIDHNHFIDLQSNSITLGLSTAFGLVDYNWWHDNTGTCSGNLCAGVPMIIYGDFADAGYAPWAQPTVPGSNQAVYVEANYWDSAAVNQEGFFDCYAGAKVVQRFNTVINNGMGNCHGTDTNPSRGAPLMEVYRNYLSMAASLNANWSITNSRGGVLELWGNTQGGTTTWRASNLQYERWNFESLNTSTFGLASPVLNWTPQTVGGTTNTLNASAYQTTHTYAANSYVTDGSCNLLTTAGGTTGSSAPACPAYGSSVTDTGGVSWTNVGGTTSAGPGGSGFCVVNPDTVCSSNSTCNALSPGDTCTRPFDAIGGYPYRDQPCVGHNQAVMGCYAFLNSPEANLTVIGSESSIVQANRDYYNYNSSFTGATGVGSGTLASMPATCTTGVAYFATDQGNWNQSGNGAGSGVLYECTATNTWTAAYTPYTYPDPLQGASGGSVCGGVCKGLLLGVNGSHIDVIGIASAGR